MTMTKANISAKRVLILVLALLGQLLLHGPAHARAVMAAPVDRTTPAPTSVASSSSSSASASTSERDDDPVIQNVRGLRNAAMRMSDRKAYRPSIKKLREALTLMHDRVFGDGRAAVTDQKEQSMDAALYSQLLADYGGVLIRAKDYDEAIDVLNDAIEMTKRIFGDSHPSLGLSLRSLADAHFARENFETALEKYKLLRKHIKLGLGVAHEAYIEVHLKIAAAYEKAGKTKRAVNALKRVLDDQNNDINGATQGIGEVYMELASLQVRTHELDEAARAGESACTIMKIRDGEASMTYAFSLNALAGVRMAQQKIAESYELLQQAHRIAIKVYGKKHDMVRASQKTLEQVQRRLEEEMEKAELASKDTADNKDEL